MNIENIQGMYRHSAQEFAEDCVSGRFPCNKWVLLECKRFLDRLEQYKVDNKYIFDYEIIDKINGLLALMNYSTGFHAGKPLLSSNRKTSLAPFQLFLIHNIFGWVDEEGIRMITEVVLLIGRKSGKSFLCSVLELLLMLQAEKFEQHAIAGKTRDISSLVKRETEQLIKSSPFLRKYFTITRDRITCKLNESFMRNLSGEADNINGLLLTSFICDEVANQPTHDILGALRLSQMSTKQRLGISISTAYSLQVNAMRDLCDLHKKILEGSLKDNSSFGLIFELDENDDYTDEKNWIKASPLQMTLEDGRKFMKSEFAKGLEVPAKMQEFRIKLLNQWVESGNTTGFIDVDDLKKCEIDTYDWTNKDVVLSFDLALTTDNTAISILTYDYNLSKYVAQSWGFIPAGRVDIKSQEEKVPYYEYIARGWCYSCGDRTVSYSFIEDFIMTIEDKLGCKVQAIGYDKYNALSTIGKLEENGFDNCVEVQQGYYTLHPACKLMKESVLDGNFAYVKNDLFTLNVGNAREITNSQNLTMVAKKASKGKIDLLASLLNGFAIIEDIEETSCYENSGITFI